MNPPHRPVENALTLMVTAILFTPTAFGQGGWTQEVRLDAEDRAAGDRFGYGVALNGVRLAVGASLHDHAAASLDNAGAVFPFEHNGLRWVRQPELLASDRAPFDQFGRSVSISADWMIVGAPEDDDGPQADEGSAYFFSHTGGGWGQFQKLSPAGLSAGDQFGYSVAVSGEWAVVGAPFTAGPGVAYLFRWNPSLSTWQAAGQLTPSNSGDDEFGSGVAIDGDTLVVGSPDHAAYVFVWNGSNWIQDARVTAATTYFGWSVSISGDTLVVGSPEEGPNDEGVAHVFVKTGSIWALHAVLDAFGPNPQLGFGESVSISGDTVAVGANGGDPPGVGAVYVSSRSGTTWPDDAVLTACDRKAGDAFGSWVSVSGNRVATGAPFDDVASDADAGSAYVFTDDALGDVFCFGDGSGTACPCNNAGGACEGCANGTFDGGCALTAGGVPSVGTDTLVLLAAQSTPDQPGLFFQGVNAINSGDGTQFGDGLRCAGGSVERLQIVLADGTGFASSTVPIAITGSVSPGDTRRYQWWYRDPASSPCGALFNLSNGLELTWAP